MPAAHVMHALLFIAPGVFDAVPTGHLVHVGKYARQPLHDRESPPAQLSHAELLTPNGYGAEK